MPAFLKIIEIIYNSLNAESKIQLIDFVFNVKLASSVKTSLGFIVPATFEELKHVLSNRYKSSKTVAQIQATLSKFVQKNMKVNSFNEKLLGA